MTADVWQRIPEPKKQGLRVVDRYNGWAYADKGRVEEVMVVERK